MKKVLESLFWGEIYPFEQIVPANAEYRDLNRRIGEEIEYFLKNPAFEDKKRFEDFNGLHERLSSVYACECFIQGFRIGSMIAAEVFGGE